MLVMGIETSCDETACAVIDDKKTIRSDIVFSQIKTHRKYGGVVPELSSRRHLETINDVIDLALRKARCNLEDINAIAVTFGPGLVGSILVGLTTANSLSFVYNLPLLGVNHLEGHIFANFIEHPNLSPPFLCLIVSGGHTCLVMVEDLGKYIIIGQTLDDAAGEAFDKVAKYLNLGYPGGPIIDTLAAKGNSSFVKFPRPNASSQDFSFSGLKTAVVNYVRDFHGRKNKRFIRDLVSSFQQAVVDTLVFKTLKAARKIGVNRIVLSGGVAANSCLRRFLEGAAKSEDIEIFMPSIHYCTDNAAMIACVGYYRFVEGAIVGILGNNLSADANLKFFINR